MSLLERLYDKLVEERRILGNYNVRVCVNAVGNLDVFDSAYVQSCAAIDVGNNLFKVENKNNLVVNF